MVGSVLAFLDGEGAFEELTRLGRFTQVTPGVAEVVEGGGEFAVVGSVLPFLDSEGASRS